MFFQSTCFLDIFYLNGGPVLHIVDGDTNFGAAAFLASKTNNLTVQKAWLAWANVYAGLPDILQIDQGSQFIAKEFSSLAAASGIHITSQELNPAIPTRLLNLRVIL